MLDSKRKIIVVSQENTNMLDFHMKIFIVSQGNTNALDFHMEILIAIKGNIIVLVTRHYLSKIPRLWELKFH